MNGGFVPPCAVVFGGADVVLEEEEEVAAALVVGPAEVEELGVLGDLEPLA